MHRVYGYGITIRTASARGCSAPWWCCSSSAPWRPRSARVFRTTVTCTISLPQAHGPMRRVSPCLRVGILSPLTMRLKTSSCAPRILIFPVHKKSSGLVSTAQVAPAQTRLDTNGPAAPPSTYRNWRTPIQPDLGSGGEQYAVMNATHSGDGAWDNYPISGLNGAIRGVL